MPKLLILNDNINSFNYITDNLCDVLNWDIYQAEQCAVIAEGRGSAILTRNKLNKLSKLHNELKKRNILTKIIK